MSYMSPNFAFASYVETCTASGSSANRSDSRPASGLAADGSGTPAAAAAVHLHGGVAGG